jgi:predicted SAM-dependent methyltransferase
MLKIARSIASLSATLNIKKKEGRLMSTVPELATPDVSDVNAEGGLMPEFGVPEALFPQATLRGLLRFEMKSFLGRLLYRRHVTPRSPYLQVGSGRNVIHGFENLDFFSVKPAELKLQVRRHDLRYPLPYPDESFRGAVSEHVLEHLYAHQAIALMRELHRVLKPGGILRMVVPDLGKYIRFYHTPSSMPKMQRSYRSGCEALWSLTQNWGHVSVWDAPMMTKQLLAAGFSSAKEVAYGKGADPGLIIDDPSHEWESLYVEAVR